MRRKQFKRNVQQQRQRRSVVITMEKNMKAHKRRAMLENGAGGLAVGLFIVLIIFAGYGVIGG